MPEMKLRSVLRNTFVIALVGALLGVCFVDVIHAAMPEDRAPMECVARICDGHAGCTPTSAAVLLMVPLAAMPSLPMIVAPIASSSLAVLLEPSTTSKHRVLPLAPRSPPLV